MYVYIVHKQQHTPTAQPVAEYGPTVTTKGVGRFPATPKLLPVKAMVVTAPVARFVAGDIPVTAAAPGAGPY